MTRWSAVLLSLCFACARDAISSVHSAAGAPAVLAFGSVRIGERKTQPLTVTNDSLYDFDLTGVQVSPPFSTAAGATTIRSGSSATIDVAFAPQAGAEFDQNLTLQLTATDTPKLNVRLTGAGVAAVPGLCGASNCGAGHICCGDQCVDPQSDAAHCGGCSPCAAGQTCNAGVCTAPSLSCDDVTAPCPGAQKCCNHACVDVAPGGLCPCTGPGNSTTFGAGTIIIPMDACYQRGIDVATLPSYCNVANSKASADDAPLKAYGLVFFLLRHQVTVYMAIDPKKTAIDGIDLWLADYGAGTTLVDRYDWATNKVVPLADTSAGVIAYRGGPFLIDSSQRDRVLKLLATDPDFAQFRSAANITVHVTNRSFPTSIAKSITAVPSRIALLQVPALRGDSPTEILVRYLASAGLDFAGAGGTPSAPGQIYDVLQEADFLPDYPRSKLKSGGYKLLWSPHWEGGTSNTPAQLASIGAFVSAGNDLFAECAAIGTLEGFVAGGTRAYYQDGSPATRFMTRSGMTGNALNIGSAGYGGPFAFGGLTSPFAQRGDFPFRSDLGRVTDFKPDPSGYFSDVVRYVTATATGTDLFTSVDLRASGKGTVVYLAGHDYSYGGPNAGEVGLTAGSRLVLNTLFSLGTNNACQ